MEDINEKLYNVGRLTRAISRTRWELVHNVKSVAELMDQMSQLQTEVDDYQRKRREEKERVEESLQNGDLDEAERGYVRMRLRKLAEVGVTVRRQFDLLTHLWNVRKIKYEKDVEIHERDKRVSNLYGENMKLKERCERAENWWWWEDWEPEAQDLDGLKREFVDRVSLLIAMESAGNHVRKWCWHRKIERVGGVNIAALGNDDLIEWVANEYLWKKLPDGMREKICASKDRRAFSLGAFKKKRQRLGTYVNAPTRSKNDRHREGVPMAREVDGA